MRKLGLALALCLSLGLAPAQAPAQSFTMPPPAGVSVIACVENATPPAASTGAPYYVQCNSSGQLLTSSAGGTVSVAGFTPAGTYATLTVAGSSVNVALPAGTVIAAYNTGTTAVSCKLSVGAGVATANEDQIPAGSSVGFVVGSNTFINCIDQTGSASNVIVLSGGSGLFTNFGGGGGGGSGGSVTQGTSPWVDSVTTWGGGTLGAMANYGTSPGAVLVPGVNAFVTSSALPTGAATSANQTNATQKTQIVDGAGAVIASTSNNLNVQCANCSGSGVSTADEATFTAGTSLFVGGGGFFQTTPTSNALTNGQQGMWQMTALRAGFVNLRNNAGTEVGTAGAPLQVSVANTAANGTAMLVTGTGGTFPISGSLTANQSVNVAQINGVTPLMGNGVTGTGSPRVTIASDNTAFSVNATLQTSATTAIGKVDPNTAASWGLGATAAAVPANAGYVGMNVGGNLTGLLGTSGGLSINNAQVNGVTTLTGTGAVGTGAQRIAVGTDTATVAGTTPANMGVVAQASTTSGQAGVMNQCAVTTAAPSYTTAQTDPMSCNVAGELRATLGAASVVAASVAPVTATNTALVVDLRPDSPGIIALGPATAANSVPMTVGPTVLGSYCMGANSGTMAAGLAGGSPVYSARYGGANLAIVRKIIIEANDTTTAFVAGAAKFDLIAARSFSASDTGGTASTLTGNNGKLRTSHATTAMSDIRIASTATLTAGTRTLDAQPLASVEAAVPTSIDAALLPTTALFQSNIGEQPLVLANNEGFVVQATVPATGTWVFSARMCWDEVTAF